MQLMSLIRSGEQQVELVMKTTPTNTQASMEERRHKEKSWKVTTRAVPEIADKLL